ncbi:hypothetical protein D3C72_2428420 [compost metagenome]
MLQPLDGFIMVRGSHIQLRHGKQRHVISGIQLEDRFQIGKSSGIMFGFNSAAGQ